MALKMAMVNRKFSVRGFYSAFRFCWDDTFEFSGESHDFWEIVFLESGEVESTEDEKVYLLRENSLILHAPMEFHRIRSAQGSSPRGFIMTFKTEGSLPEELKNGVFRLHADERAEYGAICMNILDVMNRRDDEFGLQQAADRLSAFLIRLSGKTVHKDLVHSGGAEAYRQVISDMTERISENLTLSDFAKRQSISVSYLKLLFRDYAGISPKTYYNQLRTKHAVKLIEQNLPLAEIAEKMNFSSQNYFTVFFRKHMGCSPSEYRKKSKTL